MNAMAPKSLSRTLKRVRTAALACGLTLLMGCSLLTPNRPPNTPEFQASNAYQGSGQLPRSLKRVAVLALAVQHEDEAQREAIRRIMEPVLQAELFRAGRFEVIAVTAEQLRAWTGKAQWQASERLPLDFFERLRAETECDAVLFCELTTYRAYPPLALGWRLQLVAADGPQVWWAVDQFFDANEAEVANSARRYHLAHTSQPQALTDGREILYSPRHFGSYSASVVVATCPKR